MPPGGLKLFVGAVILMVAAVVVVGLFVAGSPGKERDRRFDEQRMNELQQIASAVDFRFDGTNELPPSLEELRSAGKEQYYIPSLVDPKSGEPYDYIVTGETSYQLCATFDLPTPEQEQQPGITRPMYPAAEGPYGRDWTHPAGRHCFTLDAEVGRVVREACGLRNPCQAGQSCVTLPDRKGSYCVPAGKECLAAGCNECVIAESYPAQVRCVGEPVPPAVSPDQPVSSDGCSMWREKKTGRIDCFGCAGRVCKDPAVNEWERYSPPEGGVGIPYACYAEEDGCKLAQ